MPQAKSKTARYWCFTYNRTVNNELPSPDKLIDAFKALKCTSYVFQLEIGTEKTEINPWGQHHYQGVVTFNKSLAETTFRAKIKSICRGQDGSSELKTYASGCLEPEPCADLNASRVYCSKEKTRLSGTTPYIWPASVYLGQDLPDDKSLLPWQKTLSGICTEEPDPRAVHLIFDEAGNTGKSVWTKNMGWKYKACVIPLGLTSAQMKAAVVGAGPKRLYILDLPRNNMSFKSIFDTIEEIKRGFVVSPFRGVMQELYMSRPHIVCFTNRLPWLGYLSMDMWRIWRICPETKDLVQVSVFDIIRDQQKKGVTGDVETNISS